MADSEAEEVLIVDFSKAPRAANPPEEVLQHFCAFLNSGGVLVLSSGVAVATTNHKAAWLAGLETILRNNFVPNVSDYVVEYNEGGLRFTIEGSLFPVCRKLRAFVGLGSSVQIAKSAAEVLQILDRSVEHAAIPTVDGPFHPNDQLPFHESQCVQFKRGDGSLSDILKGEVQKYASAFLNGRGGAIYWGIDDSSRIYGRKDMSAEKQEVFVTKVTETLQRMWPPVTVARDCFRFIPVEGDEQRVVIELRYVARPSITCAEEPVCFCWRNKRVEAVDVEGWLARVREYQRRYSDLPKCSTPTHQLASPRIQTFSASPLSTGTGTSSFGSSLTAAIPSASIQPPPVTSPNNKDRDLSRPTPSHSPSSARVASPLAMEIRKILQAGEQDTQTIRRRLHRAGVQCTKREINQCLHKSGHFEFTSRDADKYWRNKAHV